jgi:hypothetical protein
MDEKTIAKMYENLIHSYLEIKPVLFDLYKRNGNSHIDAILNEMRALNDHLARCYADNITVENAHKELSKAEGHLKRLIYDCFKQLNIIFFEHVNDYEEKYFGPHWFRLDGGRFWSDYTAWRYEVVKNVEQAKKYESIDAEKACDNYQNAYVVQGKVYDLLENNKSNLQLSKPRILWMKLNSLKGWGLTTFILAVIPSVLWEIPYKTIYMWASEAIKNLLHLIGSSLTAL